MESQEIILVNNFRLNRIRLKTRFPNITEEQIEGLKNQIIKNFKNNAGRLPAKAMVVFEEKMIMVQILKGKLK